MDPQADNAHDDERVERDFRIHEAAWLETLRRDGARDLGENLEQAAALIKAAFELRDSFSGARVAPALDVAQLIRRLHSARVDHVLIGGLAVNAHGVIRATKDVDICPDPDPDNLELLASLLRDLDVRQLGVEDETLS